MSDELCLTWLAFPRETKTRRQLSTKVSELAKALEHVTNGGVASRRWGEEEDSMLEASSTMADEVSAYAREVMQPRRT
eukprot:376951-Rhodomonas_salina.1